MAQETEEGAESGERRSAMQRSLRVVASVPPKRVFDGREFRWSMRADVSKPCDYANDPKTSYYSQDVASAFHRVLLRGCCAAGVEEEEGANAGRSLIGRSGHLERSNAWTHIAAFLLVFAFAAVRPFALGWTTTSDYLSLVAILSSAITFFISSMYHVLKTLPSVAAPILLVDLCSIAISICASLVADLCATTRDFHNVPARSWLDPLAVSLIFILFFWTRRFLLPEEETLRELYAEDDGGCSLGLFRSNHYALEHTSLTMASKTILAFGWVLILPAAAASLETHAFVVWVAGASLSTFLLVLGSLLDNASVIDNALVRGKGKCGPCACNSTWMGCVFTSHTLWHVIAFAGAVLNIVCREIVIASWKP